MNSLSWLIYLADIVNAVDNFFVFSIVPCTIGAIISIGIYVDLKIDDVHDSKKERHAEATKSALTATWIFLAAFFFFGISLIVTPDKKTIMLIAASEFGEDIAQSDKAKNVGNKAYRALDKMLSEYLKEGGTE